jgi:hypothetical protein
MFMISDICPVALFMYFSLSFPIHCTYPCNIFPPQESFSQELKKKKYGGGETLDARRMV